jgi:hypothetical protein
MKGSNTGAFSCKQVTGSKHAGIILCKNEAGVG